MGMLTKAEYDAAVEERLRKEKQRKKCPKCGHASLHGPLCKYSSAMIPFCGCPGVEPEASRCGGEHGGVQCILSQGHDGDHEAFDPVNRPEHYATLDPEPITVIENWNLGFHLGQVIKYVSRAGRKDASKHVEDLEKARWYLDREIERLKKEG